MTSAADVLELMDALSAAGVTAWLFGGWAVEAQIPDARRPHGDVDLVVPARDLGRALLVVEALGYVERKPDPREHLRSERGRAGTKVQVSSLKIGASHCWVSVPDARYLGDAWLACPPDGFPAEARGVLVGRPVRCATPEVLLQSKLSSPVVRHDRDAPDEHHLRAVLADEQAVRATANRTPLPRSCCEADCAAV